MPEEKKVTLGPHMAELWASRHNEIFTLEAGKDYDGLRKWRDVWARLCAESVIAARDAEPGSWSGAFYADDARRYAELSVHAADALNRVLGVPRELRRLSQVTEEIAEREVG